MTRCDQGTPRCRELAASGYNPLGLCAEHLRAYRERMAEHTPVARRQSELGSFVLSPIGVELTRPR